MYYVRKLDKPENLQKLQFMQDILDMEADILKQEFGTKDNTLSFWKCDTVDDISDAVKATLLSTSAIKTSQFIVVEDSLAVQHGFSMDDPDAGSTGYKLSKNIHVNMIDLTYKKIGDIMIMFREIINLSDIKLIPKYEKDKVKEIIKEVVNDKLLNEESTHPQLLKDIKKYCLS